MPKVKKIAFLNGKGGCGKTTSIYHISGVLASRGENVLVIDFDKQRSLTISMYVWQENAPKKTVMDVMLGKASAAEATGKALFKSREIAKPKHYGVDCIGGDIRLEDERMLRKVKAQQFADELNRFIEMSGYSWVLIDMPPSNKAVNELCLTYIADYILAPFSSSDRFSLSGYGDILDVKNKAAEQNPTLNILGVYLANFTAACDVDKEVRRELKKPAYANTFIDIQIPHMTYIPEGLWFGRPTPFYHADMRRGMKIINAYNALVDEIGNRIGRL